MEELIHAGVDLFRVNFSHGTHEEHARAIKLVRAEARKQGRHVAILQDLQGPKIRLGRFKGGGAVLQRGAEFTLTTGRVEGDATISGVDYEGLPADVLLATGDSMAQDVVQVASRRMNAGGEDGR